jgi:hypothetical protein
MTALRKHPNGLYMDLATTTPDGARIVTRWPEGRRFVLASQCDHAAEHLARVRSHQAFTKFVDDNGEAA